MNLKIKEYNLLLTILNNNQLSENKLFADSAKKLSEKLLKYSIPITDNETKEEYITVGFYAEEAKNMMIQFLNFYDNEMIDQDYYKLLLEMRYKYLESKNASL